MTTHAHIVTVHPLNDSLTVAVADEIARVVAEGGGTASVRNLHTVGFDPTYSPGDMAAYRLFLETGEGCPPRDVREEQDLVLAANALVLVFPVYWWSMPAQMKGWIDRVFTGGFTWGRRRFDQGAPAVSEMTVHVVALAGASEERFARHGYLEAIRTQIEHGMLEYNGFGSVTWTWLWEPRRETETKFREVTGEVGESVLAAHAAPARAC